MGYNLFAAWLYKMPSTESLKDLDLLIIDFQEVGMRCYTYLSTLALTLRQQKDSDVAVLVLERQIQ